MRTADHLEITLILSHLPDFLWGRPTHPVLRRELAGWKHVTAWRATRKGCLPGILLVFVASGCCCGLTIVGSEPTEPLLTWGLIVLWALLVGQGLVVWVTGIAGTALTATVLSAEVESETYGLLRITTVPTEEIVLAKFGAAVRQLYIPLLVVMVARVCLIAGGLGLADQALIQESGMGLIGVLVELPLRELGFVAVACAAFGVLVWAVFFVLQPALLVMMHSAVGLFASSITRTRANGLIAAAGLRVALWVAGYIFGQIASAGGTLGINAAMSQPMPQIERIITYQPGLLVVGAVGATLFYILVTVGWQGALTVGLIEAAAYRARKLPYE
jgi:hypothetical protein